MYSKISRKMKQYFATEYLASYIEEVVWIQIVLTIINLLLTFFNKFFIYPKNGLINYMNLKIYIF
jgi:hypothetical protein